MRYNIVTFHNYICAFFLSTGYRAEGLLLLGCHPFCAVTEYKCSQTNERNISAELQHLQLENVTSLSSFDKWEYAIYVKFILH